ACHVECFPICRNNVVEHAFSLAARSCHPKMSQTNTLSLPRDATVKFILPSVHMPHIRLSIGGIGGLAIECRDGLAVLTLSHRFKRYHFGLSPLGCVGTESPFLYVGFPGADERIGGECRQRNRQHSYNDCSKTHFVFSCDVQVSLRDRERINEGFILCQLALENFPGSGQPV